MNKFFSWWVDNVWYKDQFFAVWLMPFSLLYRDAIRFRRFLYRIGVFKQYRSPVPVVIIGNITTGGTGKTPLLIWLAELLQKEGYKPGIVSRGYGGKATEWPQAVTFSSNAEQVGDEAVLIATRTQCPVMVGPERVEAVKSLLAKNDCDVILADDGLQHYALSRDIEIVVIDGERRFGNGYCLPAGPLREPQERINSVDFVICNGPKIDAKNLQMLVEGDKAINLATNQEKALSEFKAQKCRAIAGIGNPERFFTMLKQAGLNCNCVSFPDHYFFKDSDLKSNSEQILMTEKDAVKCKQFAKPHHWYVPVVAKPESGLAEQFLKLLREKKNG